MTNAEFQDELLSQSNLERITFSMFDRKLKDKQICHELAGMLSFHLSEKYGRDYDYEEVKTCLPYVDKTLFIAFRDANLSLD